MTRPARSRSQPRSHSWPRTGFAYLDEPRERGAVVAMAHRGGALHPDNVGVENTLTAFAGAVRLGYRYLETDVHATRDGRLLAFHDARLERLTGTVGAVADHAYDDVASLRVAGREPIPLLAELLEELPHARFNVDLKAGTAVEPMVDLVVRTSAHDRLCVGSFDERVIRAFRRTLARRSAAPVATACGVATALTLRVGGSRRTAALLRDTGTVLQVPHHHRGLRVVDEGFVRRAHAAGRHVHVWTVDAPAEMAHLLDLGVDGLITDRTDVLREVLVERGQWHSS